MRLTRKFLLALVAGNLVIVAVSAVVEVRREIALFDSDMREDARVLGESVSLAALRIWRAQGETAALALVREEAERQREMRVRWVWLERGEGDAPRVPRGELGALFAGGPVSRPFSDANDGPGSLFTYVPVRTPAGDGAAIEIEESLAERDEYLRTTVKAAGVVAAGIVGLSALLAAALGVVFVGRPTRLLVEKARRIGSGDLGGRLELNQRDELGFIADEMNAMCDRLRRAGERAQSEARARVAAVEQLRHADRLTTVGKLASGIAHELGTPLNVVGARATMIASGEVSGTEAAKSARIIADQAQRMGSIIRQLLDFARRRAARKEPRDLVAVADSTLRLLAHLAEKSGVALSVAHRVPAASVPVDEGQMQQVVTNLVMNAIQATARGGAVTVGVSCERMEPPGEVGGDEIDCYSISVSDTGQGMDAETIARVFEPFFTTKGVGEGTGLGLSVAYGIVREHGGWITARSEVRRGSTFSIYLPKGRAEP
jgi:signal transduction histidine kinase